MSVSLVVNPCDYAENNLMIINNQPAGGIKKKIAVCAKGFVYEDPDFAIRFIEWIHWMKILGAEKIYISYVYFHPKIFDAVKYFEKQEFVEIWPFHEPSGIKNEPRTGKQWWLIEENMLNDCFNRVRNLYKYVVILDFDEVLMPLNGNDYNWNDIIERVNGSAYDTLRNMVYLVAKNETGAEGIPVNFYTLRNTQYYSSFRGPGKSIFKTENQLVVNNHLSVSCLEKSCEVLFVPPNESKVLHYRENVSDRENNEIKEVKEVYKFKNILIKKLNETVEALRWR